MQAEKLLEQIIEYFGCEFIRVNEEMTHLKEFSGLTSAQIEYIDTVCRMGHPSVTDLALTLKISKPSVTVAVQKLCAGGYLKKINSCSDKRAWHIHLNDRGEMFLKAHKKCHAAIAKAIASAFKESEREKLTLMLEKILSHIALQKQKMEKSK